MLNRAALLCGAGLIVWTSSGTAQALHGLVAYSGDDRPIAFATVRLVDDDGAVRGIGSSDATGRFSIPIAEAGTFWVHVEHPSALAMVDGPVDVSPVANTFVVFHLAARPIGLEEISVEVEGRSPHLLATGFYERRLDGAGFTLDQAQIEDRRPVRNRDLLRGIPGISFLEGTSAGFSGFPITSYSLRGGLRDEPCFPHVWVDGVIVEPGGTDSPPSSDFDAIVPAQDVVGIEVYRSPAETPVQFSGLASCGVILLWTRGSR